MRILALLFILLVMLPSLSWARKDKTKQPVRDISRLERVLPACQRLLSETPPKVFRMVTYNAKDLYIPIIRNGVPQRLPDGPGWRPKSKAEVAGVVQSLRTINPDVAVIQEVESLEVLQEFNRKYLDNQYDVLLQRGNDSRGIDIGFLVRKGMGVSFELETHVNEMWRDPADRQVKKLFSRDAPALIVTKAGTTTPLFILIGNHAKAISDEHSFVLRMEQYQRLSRIVLKYQKRYGMNVPVLLAGDFNTPIHQSVEVEPILHIMTDALDTVGLSQDSPDRVTHTYIPGGRRENEYTQMDGILMSNGSRARVLRAEILRDYKDLPKDKIERAQQGSDHFPVYADIEIE